MSGKVQTSTEIVYHDAETESVWTIDIKEYDEQVLCGYECACGEAEDVYYTVTYEMPNGSSMIENYTAGETIQYIPTYSNGGLSNENESFDGWYINLNYDVGYDGIVTKDITIYAKVSTNNEIDENECCTVTYITDSKFTQKVEVGTIELWIATYDNTGLTFEADVFEGWFTDADCTEEFAGMVNEDVTLYAKITNNVNDNDDYKNYYVEYYYYGSNEKRETVKVGTTTSSLYVPTYENGGLTNETDIFDGWYIDEDCTELFIGRIIQNINLYGKITSTDE